MLQKRKQKQYFKSIVRKKSHALIRFQLASVTARPEAQKHELKACNSWELGYLEKQIQICSRDCPGQMYLDPGQVCGSDIYMSLRQASDCSITDADKLGNLLERCLARYNVASRYRTEAGSCLKKAIKEGICC